MLKLRVRLYSPTGVRGRVVQTVQDTISVTDIENGAAQVKFAVATRGAGKLPDSEFVIGVEYAIDEVFVPISRNNLFLVSSNSGDDADTTGTVLFAGATYPYAMLPKHWVVGGPNVKDGKLNFTRSGAATNAGDIAKNELDESRSFGWAPGVTYTFTHVKDSDGVNWLPGDRQQFSLSVPVQQDRLISGLAEQGMCEVESFGTELRILRPGTTRNKTNVVLGGPGFSRIPVQVEAKDRFTRLHVVMDGNKHPAFSVPVPGADTSLGTVDALITLSGVTDLPTAQKIAAARATEGAAVKREEAYEWTPAAEGVVPWRDFEVKDTVKTRARGAKLSRRVIGMVVRETSGGVTARAVVGEHIKTANARMLNKLSSVSVGGITGGSGESFLHAPLPAARPLRVNGLVVVSNTAFWGEDGSAHASVEVSWAPVTADINGQEVTIVEYEVWSRTPSGELARELAVAGTSVVVDSWMPGVDRVVVVYAVSAAGIRSEASLDLIVTPMMPSSVVPVAPAEPVLVSNVGSFTAAGPVAAVTITVPAVTLSTDGDPIEVAEYELWDADGPVLRFPVSPAKVTIPSDVTRVFRVRAGTAAGVWGDLSPSLTVTGAKPAVVVRAPSAPTLSSGAGNAFSRWDGMYVSGGTTGAHRVDVEARVGTGAWVVQGALTSAGEQIVTVGAIGDTIAVRLRAYDQLGRLTGTSDTASIVVQGILFESFDDLVQDRILDTEEKIAAVESGQVLIGRTVDGLNRTFTSVGSPGRGYLGYENLAPAIRGDGTWAEVRRNLAIDPGTTSLSSFSGWAGSGGAATSAIVDSDWTESGRAFRYQWTRKPSSNGGGGYRISSASFEPDTVFTMVYRARSNYTTSLYPEFGGGNGSGRVMLSDSGPVQVQSGEVATLWATYSYTEIDSDSRISTYASALIDDLYIEMGDVLVYPGAYQPGLSYFDGSSPDRSVDPDMRSRWLGAENASESVLEIERVAGWNAESGIAAVGVSSADGKPAIRIIGSGDRNYPRAWIPVPVEARGGGTLLGTLHIDKPMSGPESNPRRLRATGPNFVSPVSPNEPGTYEHRLEYGALTSTFWAILSAGATIADVRWTDTGLYAGVLPENATAIHNGDEWRRLEVRGGKLVVVEILIWDGQDWVAYDLWVDSLAAANSVTARVVNMDAGFANKFWANEGNFGKIQVDHLEPNVGENLNLTANGTIILMAGRQDELASDIASTVERVSTTEDAASAANIAASAAAAAAAIADGKALIAQQQAITVADGLAAQKAVFVVTGSGAEVRSKDASSVLAMSPTGVAIIQGGTPVSQWDGARFISNEIVTNRMQVANHVVEKSGSRTVFRTL